MKFPVGLSFSVFMLGFVSAWMLRPLATPQKQQEAEPLAASRSSSKRAAAKANASSPARYQKHLENIHLAAEKSDEKLLNDALQNIPISDIPAVLEAWQKRAGLSGLSYAQQSQIQKLIVRWYEQDASGSIAWLAALEPRADARMLLKGILDLEAGRDLDRTLALAEQFVSKGSEGCDLPYEMELKMKDCDAAMVGKILRTFPGSGTRALEIDFKEGFDFATLGKIFAEDHATNKEAGRGNYPVNFIKEWAMKDVHSALDWSLKNSSLPVSDIHEVMKALAYNVGSAKANEILVDKLSKEPDREKKYQCTVRALTFHASPEEIAYFVEQLPGQRIDHFEGLAKHASHWFPADRFKSDLLTLMTPEERVSLVPKIYGRLEGLRLSDQITHTLKSMGHSPEEIKAMLPTESMDD